MGVFTHLELNFSKLVACVRGFRDQSGSARPDFFSDLTISRGIPVVANPLAPNWLDASIDDNALISGIWSSNTVRNLSGWLEVAGRSVS